MNIGAVLSLAAIGAYSWHQGIQPKYELGSADRLSGFAFKQRYEAVKLVNVMAAPNEKIGRLDLQRQSEAVSWVNQALKPPAHKPHASTFEIDSHAMPLMRTLLSPTDPFFSSVINPKSSFDLVDELLFGDKQWL